MERYDEAIALLHQQEALLRHLPGEEDSLASGHANLRLDYNCVPRCEEAIALAEAMAARLGGQPTSMGYAQYRRMCARLSIGRIDEAAASTRRSIARWHRDGLLVCRSSACALLLA